MQSCKIRITTEVATKILNPGLVTIITVHQVGGTGPMQLPMELQDQNGEIMVHLVIVANNRLQDPPLEDLQAKWGSILDKPESFYILNL